jgi:hypothetical protein
MFEILLMHLIKNQTNSWTTKNKHFVGCYMNHIDDDILASQLMATKSFVASCKADKDSEKIEFDVLLLHKKLRELPAAYSEILKVLQILLILPLTTASNERFSVLKRVKTYIRSTCGHDRQIVPFDAYGCQTKSCQII